MKRQKDQKAFYDIAEKAVAVSCQLPGSLAWFCYMFVSMVNRNRLCRVFVTPNSLQEKKKFLEDFQHFKQDLEVC